MMQASNRLKTALSQGRKSYGAWQMIPGANVSRVLARSGVDWVLVDCEHGNLDGMSCWMAVGGVFGSDGELTAFRLGDA